MRKRAGLVRALVSHPKIVLHDEPTSGLDPISSSIINKLVNRLKTTGITQVLVTHDMNSAFEVADRIALLHEGQIHARKWMISATLQTLRFASFEGNWASSRGLSTGVRMIEDRNEVS